MVARKNIFALVNDMSDWSSLHNLHAILEDASIKKIFFCKYFVSYDLLENEIGSMNMIPCECAIVRRSSQEKHLFTLVILTKFTEFTPSADVMGFYCNSVS